MSKAVKTLINVLLLLIGFTLGYYLIDCIQSSRVENRDLRAQNRNLQSQLDSVFDIIDGYEFIKDTMWVDVHHWNTKYDTIVKDVDLLPPDSLLKTLDYLTGDTLDFSYLWEDNAIVPLPRIRNAVVGLYERERLEGVVVRLYSIIDVHEKQTRELYVTLGLKDGQIVIRDAVIVEQGKEIKDLKMTIIRDRAIGGVIILFLMALLFSN